MGKVRLGGVGVCVLLLLVGCPKPRFLNAASTQSVYGGLYDSVEAGSTDTNTSSESRDVVEPDVIRRAGKLLYVLNQYRGLTLVDLDTQRIVSRVSTAGYPRDLYVVGDRAYVLVGYSTNYTIAGNTLSFSVASRLYVVDISNPAQAGIVGQFDLEGDLVDSRLVGNVLYAVCAQYTYWWDGVVSTAMKSQTSGSWVTSVNVSDPANPQRVADVSLDEMGSVIQATDSAIFVASPDWAMDQTIITYVDISDPAGNIRVAGNIAIAGTVADKYKMDAYQGVLRVVSNELQLDSIGRLNHITTVDLADPDHLTMLGRTQLRDADGESLFATRFDGPRAYVVTYLVKDPLFIVDLSDPAHPAVTGTLEAPGWSTYIEPQGDRLIALGVDDTDSQRRVCVTLYNVADPTNPVQVGDRISFGEGWTWSTAYDDVKAFTILDNVLIVPFSGWTENGGSYDRLQFISYSPDGLGAGGYVDVEGGVQRSLTYADGYYAVTPEQLVTIDGSNLAAPSVTHRLTLAEYVADVLELTPTLTADIVSEYDSGKTLVSVTDSEASTSGSVEVSIGSFTQAFAYGTSVVLIGTEWDDATYESSYHVATVDCTTASTPIVKTDLVVDVTPYWGYWYYPYYSVGDITDAAEGGTISSSDTVSVGVATSGTVSSDIAPWWWWGGYGSEGQENAFLNGDTLVLRCMSETFDTVMGTESTEQGLAFVDLAEGHLTSTLGLGLSNITSMKMLGGKLYIATQTAEGYQWFKQVVANYIQVFDIATHALGAAANIPGTFVQYDAANSLLLVRNDQWSGFGEVTSTLQTVRWQNGAEAEPLQSFDLPVNVGTIMGRGARVFVDGYDNGYTVSSVSISADGALALAGRVSVSGQWGSLLDAHETKVYVTLGNAIAVYDFAGEPVLQGVYTFMGSPTAMRFGTEHAYVALGYSGIGELPL